MEPITVEQPSLSPLYRLLGPQRLTEVVDIGANPIDGDPPYKPMLDAGLCHVTGFEPQQEALAELQRKKGPHERYLPYAVGDGNTHTLNICRASGMTSLFEPDPATLGLFEVLKPLGEVVRQVEVPTRKLNDVSEIEQLDFLKIDIQGGELAVFKSGGGSLPRPWPCKSRFHSSRSTKTSLAWARSTSNCAPKVSCHIASPQ